ncbi:hypothetical protein SAMN02745127_03182 [Oceanospirillum multiglobuliferum]|nr:hypothetical protein SAMN02745127_03182 [Oceanospirillum multiglobuliferum]
MYLVYSFDLLFDAMSSFYQWDGGDLLIACHLQPKASKDEFCGLHDDRLKIRITAPPIEGKANTHLCKFLAKQFGVSKSMVSIINGELGRQKRVRISQPTKLPDELGIMC